ncbi:MAG: hypothetical protein ACTS44_00780 [Candidatus Hodgkinia cicadicola]
MKECQHIPPYPVIVRRIGGRGKALNDLSTIRSPARNLINDFRRKLS